jgi:hypothetical protein
MQQEHSPNHDPDGLLASRQMYRYAGVFLLGLGGLMLLLRTAGFSLLSDPTAWLLPLILSGFGIALLVIDTLVDSSEQELDLPLLKRLFTLTPARAARWQKQRERVFWYFVLWYGIIAYGGGTFLVQVISRVLPWLTQPSGYWSSSAAPNLFVSLLALAGISLAAGFVFGVVVWFWQDYQYLRYLLNARTSDDTKLPDQPSHDCTAQDS